MPEGISRYESSLNPIYLNPIYLDPIYPDPAYQSLSREFSESSFVQSRSDASAFFMV